jgi:hypothetical protein
MVVTRRPDASREDEVGWEQVPDAVRAADAIVNLAGEPIADGRWTPLRKERIRESRVSATRTLVDAVVESSSRPSVLVSASAVGFYGSRGDEPLDETSEPGTGFLAGVCQAWEQEAMRAEPLGLRVVRLRIGVVLANDGGALGRMLPLFRVFLGGPLGSGRQWMSWIHRDDVVGLVLAALGSTRLRGAVNATAPQPVTNREFAEALGRALGRPALLRAPALALRLGLGEMADMLLTGQRVFPAAAERGGYRWRFAELGRALRAVTRR